MDNNWNFTYVVVADYCLIICIEWYITIVHVMNAIKWLREEDTDTNPIGLIPTDEIMTLTEINARIKYSHIFDEIDRLDKLIIECNDSDWLRTYIRQRANLYDDIRYCLKRG